MEIINKKIEYSSAFGSGHGDETVLLPDFDELL